MATVAVARPSNALSGGSTTMRTRRDAPRLSIKRGLDTNGDAGPAKRKRFVEPFVRTRQHYIKKFAGQPPSMVVHLHPSYFKIEGQEGSFPHDSPMRVFLQHLRQETVPHEMMEELLASNTPFYDGCLIVELQDHRNTNGKNRARRQDTAGDNAQYSMHTYSSYITPSPLTPYPKKAAEQHDAADVDDVNAVTSDKQRNVEQGGPKTMTLVLQPTDLSRNTEMLILANTPAPAMKASKRHAETPSTAQPPTPHLSVPATPLIAASRTSPGQEGKMCLDADDMYRFQAEVLLSTEPPLLLDVFDSHEALDALAHPLHSALPPSPKTRKRTTAELAADDAQAAEAERRMLIMDERIKPSARSGTGVNSGDNGGAAASLGFTRFKTIAMVREKQEDIERHKKEEEAQAAVQRRQQDEANAAAQRADAAKQEQQKRIMTARAQQARDHYRNQQQAQAAAQAQAMAQQSHGHPGSNNMMINPNFQQPQLIPQASPAPRHHTPMQSSPMVQQNGVPLARTTSQQAGSPPRPSSAVPNQNLMTQQLSQQQHGSRIATPHMQHGTPNMANAMPGRQLSQTPRIPHGSPAPGTPGTAAMAMQTPGQNIMTPEQMAMFQQAQRQMAMQGQGGSPAQVANMTPEQIQNIRQQHHVRQQALQMQAQAQAQAAAQQGNDPRFAAAIAQRQNMMLQQSQQQALRQRMLAQQQHGMGQGQQLANMGQAGSPQVGRPSMSAHGHPQGQHGGDMNGNVGQQQQQLTPEQQNARNNAIRAAQGQLAQLAQQYNGIMNIPQNITASLSPVAQMLLRQQHSRQQAQRTQAMVIKAQQAQNGGQQVAGNSAANPEYMATLREHQQLLAMQQAQGGMAMGGANGLAQFGRGQQGGDNLGQHMQAFQQSLQRNGQNGMQ